MLPDLKRRELVPRSGCFVRQKHRIAASHLTPASKRCWSVDTRLDSLDANCINSLAYAFGVGHLHLLLLHLDNLLIIVYHISLEKT